MYRMLKIASTKNHLYLHFPPYSSCSLCNGGSIRLSGENTVFRNSISSRNISTEELKKLQSHIRKNRKRKVEKKYVELLEVKADESKFTGAVIRTLKANDVKQLSEEPELSLEQFHHVFNKCNLKSKKSLTPKTNPEASDNSDSILRNMKLAVVNDEVLRENTDQETLWDLIERDTEDIDMYSNTDPQVNIPLADVLLDPVDKTSKKKKKKKKKKIESESGKEEKKNLSQPERGSSAELMNDKFNAKLNSYIELCVNCNHLTLALRSLKRYVKIQQYQPKFKNIRGPEPFDILMQGFASKANLDKILLLMKWMSDIGIEFTPQTFSACFECCGRLPTSEDNEKILQKFHSQMQTRKITFNDLIKSGNFIRNQRHFVLKSIMVLQPDFKYEFTSSAKHYNLDILQELNSNEVAYQSTVENVITNQQLTEAIKEQMYTESQVCAKIKSVVAPDVITPEIEFHRMKWNELNDKWRNEIKEIFIKNVESLRNELKCTRKCYNINIYPYLIVLSPDKYVDIIMSEIQKLAASSETFSPVIRSLRKSLGLEVKHRYDFMIKEQSGVNTKLNRIYREYCKWFIKPELREDSLNTRHEWQSLCHESANSGPSLDAPDKPWPPSVMLEVGKFLYEIILNYLKLDANILDNHRKESCMQPAFHRIFRYQAAYLIEEVKPHPVLCKLYRNSKQENLLFDISMLPMLCPPVPWTSIDRGGYIHTKVHLIRLESNMNDSVKAYPSEKMYPIFDSLNQLSAVPWKINKPVLDVMLEVFRKGGSKQLNVPFSSNAFMEAERRNNPNNVYTPYQKFLMYRRKSEMYGLWCESLYRLSIADYFRDRIFWFPHNLDFRGRVYPVPPYLTHLGSDLARCVLVFAKGQKLGPKGLDWLKIHCINLTGLKKRDSSSERLKYANEILPQILDSAENPLNGEMWWAQSEEMWQTLACCMEIRAAIDSGDPENYVCHFPVHQDGSCNGLQHYAALGRDEFGGKSVNLTVCDVPQDVYSCVVDLVEERRRVDAENGNEIAQTLEGVIKRKVIKQTIMTTVYGVTQYGGRLQIAKQLQAQEGLPASLVWNGSQYLVSSTFICLRNMFKSAKQIQDWFTECAKYISGDLNKFVEWETPLGLPVMQPYRKVKKVVYDEKSEVQDLAAKRVLAPNNLKQKNAFPPNYIHSLDSTHMMLTSLFCEKKGITFVSVHDCFWTHPSSVNVMNKICREQFVSLHSTPILENLSEFFIRKYLGPADDREFTLHNGVFIKIPNKGDLELKNVLNSEYFFS